MTIQLAASELQNWMSSGDDLALDAALVQAHAIDIAEALSEFDVTDVWQVLLRLSTERQAKIVAHMPPSQQLELAASAQGNSLSSIVSRMHADDRADFFKHLPQQQQQGLMRSLAHTEREDIRRLTAYEEGTAGALMTSSYVVLKQDISAGQALNLLRAEAPSRETIDLAYIVDDARSLLGTVRLQDIVMAFPGAPIADIMDPRSLAVGVDDDQEDVAHKIARYDVSAVPVVDAAGRLVGIITHDDAIDVLQEEATEDIFKSGTVQGLTKSIKNASILILYRARVFWLVLLVFGNIFSSAGIAAFEDTIATHVALVFFLPLLIGSGGNAGAQSATLMIRGLSTGDVSMNDWQRLLGRELLVATLLGLTMAAAVSGIGFWRGGPAIALIVTLSMILIVIVGSLVGMCLPFLLSRSKLDPATASAPLVTSIADAVGVIIYFAIAEKILGLA